MGWVAYARIIRGEILVAMPLAELGAAAVDQLIARIARQQAGDVMIREPMKLLSRRSVTRPRLAG